MFETRTLFIVGAGASKEAKLPSGKQLATKIADMLNFKFEHGRTQISGDVEITDALRYHVRREDGQPGDINPYLNAGGQISDAMPQATSIDNFIDVHRGNHMIELCGKLAIVHSILEAEQKSSLFFENGQLNRNINFKNIQGTWYDKFLRLLAEGCRRNNVVDIFQNVSFIIFNYDRCIEHFLFYAMKNYYGIQDGEAASIMHTLSIIHPYGTVGHLPWQTDSNSIPFGGRSYGKNLLALAGEIQTFTERVEDASALSAIRQLVHHAKTIVFLGFAFHKQNMELMQPPTPKSGKRVFATASGISDSDCRIIEEELVRFFDEKQRNIQVNLRNGLKCSDLFDEFSRSLSTS